MEEGQRKLFHFDDVFSPFTLAYFPRPLQRARCLIEAPYSPSSSEGQSVGRPDRQTIIRHSNWICLGVCRETNPVAAMLREGSRNTRNLGTRFSAADKESFLFLRQGAHSISRSITMARASERAACRGEVIRIKSLIPTAYFTE